MEEILEVLRQSADGACAIDGQQRIVSWNESAEALLGYRAEEVIGRLCYQVIAGRGEGGHRICRRGCVPFIAGTRGEKVPSFDILVRTKDGQPRWINVSILVAPDPGARRRAVIHLFRDVDAKKQAEAFAAEVAARARQLKVERTTFLHKARDTTGAVTRDGRPPGELTPREFQVLELLARGADTETIATELIISEATARNHIQHILHKLGVHSRLEAVAYAREHDLI